MRSPEAIEKLRQWLTGYHGGDERPVYVSRANAVRTDLTLGDLRAIVSNGQEPDETPGYGTCPQCGAQIVSRERRPDGNDRCENGHVFPSREAVK